ncbi:MAG: bifunctional nuclease domain-containing protein [Saprospiraceae bacterium]
MKRIELEIIALSHTLSQSHNYAVILQERNGSRKLPIVIGGFEAQAIAVAMERMSPNRPLTHDLFKSALDTFEIDLKEIVISNLLDGIFFAKLVCMHNSESHEIDSRTSDALAMAVRFTCPIYTYEFILEAAGVEIEEEEAETKTRRRREKQVVEKSTSGFGSYSEDELNQKLEEALQEEKYELAAKIRDEIKKRKESSQ